MKKLFSKIWAFVEMLFVKAEDEVMKLVPVAVNIVEAVKNTMDDSKFISVVEIVKFAIPGDADDKLIDKVLEVTREYIPKIALQLGIIQSINDKATINEKMVAVVEALKNANADDQNDYWHELATFILRKLADGKLTLGEAGSIAEYHYQNYVKK